MTKSEIKHILDENGIEYDSSLNKLELEALLPSKQEINTQDIKKSLIIEGIIETREAKKDPTGIRNMGGYWTLENGEKSLSAGVAQIRNYQVRNGE